MDSKFIDINGLTIHYVEKNAQENNTLFFIHGNSGFYQIWHKQLGSELFNNYKLIAIDLPGHGKSSDSKVPELDYSPLNTATILSQIIKSLAKTNPYILIGFSYGTNVVVEMLKHELIPKGLVLAGSCVLGKGYGMERVFVQGQHPSILFYNEPDKDIVEKWFSEELVSASKYDIKTLLDGYLKVSSDFKPALFKTAVEGQISDEILALKELNVPVCLIFGAEDKLIHIDYLDSFPFPIWNAQIYKLPNAGHWVNMDNPNIFNQIVFEYAQENFKSSHA
jgi:pimeloyl-ACP methyl ester carboxylesterase